jgi:Uma2 family endonuclease
MDDADMLVKRHKLDVHAFHRMAETGILGENDRVELIDGDLIDMAPIGQGHVGMVNRLTEVLVLACSGRAIVSGQNPIRLDARNEPQPDFAILRRRPDFYETGERAGPIDVLLVIEVADSSLRFDHDVKLPLYARAGIPEVWIVDLRRRVVEVYRVAREGQYTQFTTCQRGDTLSLAVAPDIELALEQIFG